LEGFGNQIALTDNRENRQQKDRWQKCQRSFVFGMLFGVLVKRILTNMLKLWYNRQNTKEKFLDFGAIVGE